MTGRNSMRVARLTRFGLTTPDPARLASFYRQAFGCRIAEPHRRSGAEFERLMGTKGGADSRTLTIGQDVVELLTFDDPGRPYPMDSTACDPIFQHFALVVPRMDDAFARLSASSGWRPISIDGPQRLPAASGGVTAFKFRDPDGHPLELIEFPLGSVPARWRAGARGETCLGIDHSAIAVRSNRASAAFYSALGLSVASRTRNEGREQDRLDGVDNVAVDVAALLPANPTPHVEVLAYTNPPTRREAQVRANDVASTRLTFEAAADVAEPALPKACFDPDLHRLVIEKRQSLNPNYP